MRRLLFALALLACGPAWAGDTVTTKHVTARLIADVASVRAGQTAMVGLQLRVAPGWHTYWKNPGDAGAPPDLAWTLPEGTTVGPLAFPTPTSLAEGPLMTYAHTGTLLLTAPLTVAKPPVTVRLRASWLVCREVCVPEEGEFSLDLPAGDGAASADAQLFRAAAQALPRPAPGTASIAPDNVLTLTDPAWTAASVKAARFVPDTPDTLNDAAPQPLTVRDGALSLALTRKAHGPLSGILVVTDGGGQATGFLVSATPGVAATGLWTALGLALLGGALLNLMPCVFPVLALKAAGIAALGGDRAGARRSAVGYAAGAIVAFTALGAALIVARAIGATGLGWGFQFQSTAFVLGMAFVLFAVGLNLSGVYAIGAGRLTGVGQNLTRRGGWLGDAATGALAVVVATPCTAPFMAAALASALTAPAWRAVLTFAGLGAGLAAPFVLVAFIPAFARALPRPGRWMETLRQFLAFPIYAASAWLVWVASVQAGADAVLVAGAGLVALGLGGWLLGRDRRWLAAIAGMAAVATLALPLAPVAAVSANGEAFSTTRLAALRAAGRPVFVDMSAAWCITCLVNERVALGSASVKAALSAADVQVLRGDWTSRDADIGAFLAAQGRDGVPLYQFYRAGAAIPETLPQLLTPGIVLAALADQPRP